MVSKELNKKVINYFEMMISEFCVGNDNEYSEGTLMSFLYEEIEKGDLDLYDDEDVENFYYVKEFILNEGGEFKYMGNFNNIPLEYTFKIVDGDIECSWVEPK